MVKKIKVPVQKNWRPTVEDMKLLADLKEKLEPRQGPVKDADLIRMGIRKLAESEGLR